MTCPHCSRDIRPGEATIGPWHEFCFNSWRPDAAIAEREDIPRKPIQSEDATMRYERFSEERKVQ